MSSTSDLYGVRHNGVPHGDVFTSPEVVRFMLDLTGYTSDRNLSEFKILEPCFGCGDFLTEIQKRILESSVKYGFNALDAFRNNVFGCEIDRHKYDVCVSSLKKSMPDYLPINLRKEDFLFSRWDTKFDFIVGNPPYIRYENIPEDKRDLYRLEFSTFHYRCDMYVLFYEHSLDNLSAKGRHCFVCSNRWLKNEYGKKLRAMISSSYSLDYVINVEPLNVFQESVLAYPAITLISNEKIYHGTKMCVVGRTEELKLPLNVTPKNIPDGYDWDNLFLNDDVSELTPIEEQGFIIGIGVATGADKVFISSNLKGNIEDALLLPIVNAKDLTGDRFVWKGAYLLNPYGADGKLIDIDRYPKAKQYLKKFRGELERRHIVGKGRQWYSLIDKVKPTLKSSPKVLLPDISGNSVIFVDEGSFYPSHNIYYVTGNSKEELYLLAAILMSDFARNQVKCISNKMNGGFPRWQSQTIRKIRLPRVSSIPNEIRRRLLDAYRKYDLKCINAIVDDVVESQIHAKDDVAEFPKSLFDYECSACAGLRGASAW